MATRGRPTKWSGAPARYKDLGKLKLNTIISGHLTQEQIDAYQQYFRIEEISNLLRQAQEQRKPLVSLLPSGYVDEANYKRDPSPPPTYDSNGQRTNTRENRTRASLENERHYLIDESLKSVKNYMPPVEYRKPAKTTEKIYIPVKDYPEINFVGMLLGPRGKTLRDLQESSGAKLAIRGKGSVKDGRSDRDTHNNSDTSSAIISSASYSNPSLTASGEDDLHVLITSDSQESIAKAIKLTNEVIEKAISSPVGQNDLKRGQLRELAILNGTLRETKPYEPQQQRRGIPAGGLDVSAIVCNICGKVGHFARDCLMRKERDESEDSSGIWKKNKPNLPNLPNLPAAPWNVISNNVPNAPPYTTASGLPVQDPSEISKQEAIMPKVPSFVSNMTGIPLVAPPPTIGKAPDGLLPSMPPSSIVAKPPPPPLSAAVAPPPPPSGLVPPPPPPSGPTVPPPPPSGITRPLPPSGLPPPPPTSKLPPPPPSTVSKPPPPPK